MLGNNVQRIGCGFSCFNLLENGQTRPSQALRITSVALGAILAITGVLVLCGVPGVNALGLTGGCALVGAGSLVMLCGLILKRGSTSPQKQSTPENSSVSDVNESVAEDKHISAVETHSSSPQPSFSETSAAGDGGNSAALETKRELVAIKFPLIVNASVAKLQRFSAQDIKEMLPTSTEVEEQLLEGLFKLLTIEQVNTLLPKMSGEQLSFLPTEHLQNKDLILFSGRIFTRELSAMFSSTKKPQQQLSGELVNQLVKKLSADWKEFVSLFRWSESQRSVSPKLDMPAQILASLTDVQLKDTDFAWDNLTEEQLSGMYNKLDVTRKAVVPLTVILRVLPILGGDQMIFLPEKYVTDPSFPMRKLSSEQKGGMVLRATLDIATVNAFLPDVSSRDMDLSILPDEHLQNPELDLSKLTDAQVHSMFPMGERWQNNPEAIDAESKRRIGLLSIESLNQILPRLSEDLLEFISDEHLQNKKLDLSGLDPNKVVVLCSTWDESIQSYLLPSDKVNLLHENVWKQIESMTDDKGVLTTIKEMRVQKA